MPNKRTFCLLKDSYDLLINDGPLYSSWNPDTKESVSTNNVNLALNELAHGHDVDIIVNGSGSTPALLCLMSFVNPVITLKAGFGDRLGHLTLLHLEVDSKTYWSQYLC